MYYDDPDTCCDERPSRRSTLHRPCMAGKQNAEGNQKKLWLGGNTCRRHTHSSQRGGTYWCRQSLPHTTSMYHHCSQRFAIAPLFQDPFSSRPHLSQRLRQLCCSQQRRGTYWVLI